MKYTISYKSAAGITLQTECLPFDTDADASAFAKKDSPTTALIEVWKDDNLLVRFEQAAKAARA